MRRPFVSANGLGLAGTGDTDNASAPPSEAGKRRRCRVPPGWCVRRTTASQGGGPERRWCTAAALCRSRPRQDSPAGGWKRYEIGVRDRVLEFLPEEFLLNKYVYRGRRRVRVLALEQPDGSRVLFAAEHELGLSLAPCRLVPDWHGDRQHHGHHAHGDEQNGHGIAAFELTA